MCVFNFCYFILCISLIFILHCIQKTNFIFPDKENNSFLSSFLFFAYFVYVKIPEIVFKNIMFLCHKHDAEIMFKLFFQTFYSFQN